MSEFPISSRPVSPLSDSDFSDMENEDDDADFFDKTAPSLPASTSTSEFHCPIATDPNYVVLQTNFNIDHKENKKIPYPRPDNERQNWTDMQRVLARRALVPEDSADFAFKVGI